MNRKYENLAWVKEAAPSDTWELAVHHGELAHCDHFEVEKGSLGTQHSNQISEALSSSSGQR